MTSFRAEWRHCEQGDVIASNTKQKSQNAAEKVKQLSLPKMQLSIFDAHSETFDEIRKLLEDTDINRLTPVEALLKLQEIKSKLK